MLQFAPVVLSLGLSISGIMFRSVTQLPTDTNPSDQAIQKLDLKSGMHPPKAIFQTEAQYPEEGRQQKLNGKCAASIIVDVYGKPMNVKIVRCSNKMFAQPTLDAVTRYKFNPATTGENKAVPVKVAVEVAFHISGGHEVGDPLRYGLSTPPGTTSSSPNPDGIYPLTKVVTSPKITEFSDQGYQALAFPAEGASPCDMLLTIDANGKPSDPVVFSCDRELLVKPVMNSLLASHYTPGTINGKAIAVRTLIHLEYGQFAGTQ